jgi:hypothetical protein
LSEGWAEEGITVAMLGDPVVTKGWTKGGLGIVQCDLNTFMILHLGSGHKFCFCRGFLETAQSICDDLLAVGDWTFNGLDGWQNQDPELLNKAAKVWEKWGWLLFNPSAHLPRRDDVAAQIARGRA